MSLETLSLDNFQLGTFPLGNFHLGYFVWNPPAPACQGHRGCGYWKPTAFQQSSVILSAVQQSAVKLFTRPRVPCDLPLPPNFHWIQFPPPRKSIKFYAWIQGSKISKLFLNFPKMTQIYSQIKKTITFGKFVFAIHSLRKPGFRNPKRTDFVSVVSAWVRSPWPAFFPTVS